MKIRNKQTGQIIEVTEDQLANYGLSPMAKGGMIKRADGSYSRRGLWDNIRANKGSGRKPTKEMLKQEKKIRAAEKAYGGYMASGGCMECGGMMEIGGKLPKEILKARLESHMSSGEAQDYLDNYAMGGMLDQAGDGKWIQKATKSIKRRGTEGVCTGSKFGGPSCPPGSKRYNLAKTFRKMAKSRKDDGGYSPMYQDAGSLNLTSMLDVYGNQNMPVAPEEMQWASEQQELPNAQFVSGYSSTSQKKAPAKVNPSKTTSIVDYLASVGMKSDKESRKALAKKLGIKDYDFSASKNLELLNKLRNAKGSPQRPYELPEVTVTASRQSARPGSKANPYELPEVQVTAKRTPDAVRQFQQYYNRPQPVYRGQDPYAPASIQNFGPSPFPAPPRTPVLRQGYADGGYVEGEQYEMSDAEINRLRAMGYKIKEV